MEDEEIYIDNSDNRFFNIRQPIIHQQPHFNPNPYTQPKNDAINRRENNGYHVHTLYINSRNREDPATSTVGDFTIRLGPNDGRVTKIGLKNVNFPFAFNNVTVQYGNTLFITAYGNRITLSPIYQTTITIQPGWYSIPALILELNIKIANWLTGAGATFSLTFSFSALNGVLQLNTTDNNVMVQFNPTVTPYSANYLYFMLGLSKTQITTIFSTPRFFERLPFVASQELPFAAIFIYIDVWPNNVFSTGVTGATFVVPTSNYKGLDTLSPNPGEDVSHGIFWNDQNHFKQEYTINRTVENTSHTRITLTDDQGNSLTRYTQENDWSMCIEVTKMQLS